MKIQKLNARGVAHHLLLALIIVGVGIFGAYKVVVSHAATPSKNSATSCQAGYQKDSAGQCYTTSQPSCPSGTTLHSGADPQTGQPRYFCQASNGTNANAQPASTAPSSPPQSSSSASNGCQAGYQKDSAGQCYTTTKPTCPAGTTLHTGGTSNQPRYFCEKTSSSSPSPSSQSPSKSTNSNNSAQNSSSNPSPKSNNVAPTQAVKPVKKAVIDDPNKCSKDKPIVRYGDGSNCVAKLQKTLGVKPDGKFGGNTRKAVKNIQDKNHLKNTTGSLDSCTWHAIRKEHIPTGCIKPAKKTSGVTQQTVALVESCEYTDANHHVITLRGMGESGKPGGIGPVTRFTIAQCNELRYKNHHSGCFLGASATYTTQEQCDKKHGSWEKITKY